MTFRSIMPIAAATVFAITTTYGGDAHAACAAAEATGEGFNVAHARQVAQFNAMRQVPGASRAQAEYSQPACYYLDDPTAAADLVRCTVTVSWCTAPPLPQQPPTTIGIPGRPAWPPQLPPNSRGRYCSQLSTSMTATSLSKARTTVYRAIEKALRVRGTQFGASNVTAQEPACFYHDNPNARADLVTCNMTAVLCR